MLTGMAKLGVAIAGAAADVVSGEEMTRRSTSPLGRSAECIVTNIFVRFMFGHSVFDRAAS